MDGNMTTEQLAEIFVVIESYLKAAYNTDIVTMIEKIKENGNNFFEVMQFILYTEPNGQRLKSMYEYMHDRIDGLEVNNPGDFIINSLYEMYTKGLVRIEKEVITMSSLSPNGVSQSKSDKEIRFSSRIKNVDDTYSIIDAKLSEIGMILPWEFIAKIEDQYYIQSLKREFPFLAMIPEWKSLEGFLYPDTYYLEEWIDVKDQLIKAQIKNFEKKVWNQYSSRFVLDGLKISPYGILTLASIIENEEKNKDNKPIIAGIFVNRLNKWMRLDADVTLCYGLWITYNKCRENIVKNLDDARNLYNTRQNYWLTPTPISSPTVETIDALLNYKKTSAIYYLHDQSWLIHYADTLQGHNENKRIYL